MIDLEDAFSRAAGTQTSAVGVRLSRERDGGIRADLNLYTPLCVKGVMTCSLRFTYTVNNVFAQINMWVNYYFPPSFSKTDCF